MKKKILEIAFKKFVQQGYEATTIEEIILEANISKGGLYHYFKSKEILMDAVIIEKVTMEIEHFKNDIKKVIGVKNKIIKVLNYGINKENIDAKPDIFFYKSLEISNLLTIQLIEEILVEEIYDKKIASVYANYIHSMIGLVISKKETEEKKQYYNEFEKILKTFLGGEKDEKK